MTNKPSWLRWRKLSAAKWEDAWLDRLAGFAERLAITTLAGAKTIRVEIFQLTKKEADTLTKHFGGSVAPQKTIEEIEAARPRPPIAVRGKLVVVSSEAERKAVGKKPALLIPAGMAFGTGEHATTATCLRYLADLADAQAEKWEMLDLGCGSGILALAARMLGSTRVEAGDFDPHAVRVTKENIALNALDRIKALKLDVREWTPKRTWPVVAANIYSELLITVAPKLAAATSPGGALIFSGVMRHQEDDVVAALKKAGLRLEKITRKGKWVTGLMRKSPPR